MGGHARTIAVDLGASGGKVFAGLFHKESAKAEKDAVQNFAVGLDLAVKANPSELALQQNLWVNLIAI